MLSEDLDLFLNDFGVSVTAGAISTLGILDAPSVELFGGEALMEDYQVTVRTDELGTLLYGDIITVDGATYRVKEPRQLVDSRFTALLLERDSDLEAPELIIDGNG
jgi:hypothetical protein